MTNSPTFIARFSDGQITRMTTHCSPGKLDLARGAALAQCAYRSRTGGDPPAIIEAQFIDATDGKVLAQYTAAQIAERRREQNDARSLRRRRRLVRQIVAA
jgi:hypothetical protein